VSAPAGSAAPPPGALSSSPVAGPPRSSAAEQLSGFFAEAERMHTQLRHAAALVNEGFRSDTVRLDRATLDAVRDVRPETLAQRIPGGLDRDRMRAVLLVYSELVSRRAAMNRVVEYASESPLARDSDQVRDLLACLAHGSAAAADFGADLAAAKAVASHGPPVTARPNSRDAAEVAVRAGYIRLANNGCGDCGGRVLRDLTPLTWSTGAPKGAEPFEGTVVGIRFRAWYRSAQGWAVDFRAC
jgi:hypothetical protein